MESCITLQEHSGRSTFSSSATEDRRVTPSSFFHAVSQSTPAETFMCLTCAAESGRLTPPLESSARLPARGSEASPATAVRQPRRGSASRITSHARRTEPCTSSTTMSGSERSHVTESSPLWPEMELSARAEMAARRSLRSSMLELMTSGRSTSIATAISSFWKRWARASAAWMRKPASSPPSRRAIRADSRFRAPADWPSMPMEMCTWGRPSTSTSTTARAG